MALKTGDKTKTLSHNNSACSSKLMVVRDVCLGISPSETGLKMDVQRKSVKMTSPLVPVTILPILPFLWYAPCVHNHYINNFIIATIILFL